MEVTARKEFKISYSIDERKLRELTNIFMEVSDNITFSVDCIDGKSMEFISLDDLICHPNRIKSQFTHIEMSNNFNSKVRLSINFNINNFRSISYRITAEEDKVDFYSRKIEDFILSLKQWYSIFNCEISFYIIVPALSISTGYLLKFYNYDSLINILLLAVLQIIYFSGFNFINKTIFPVALFKLGDGIERAEKTEKIRNFFISGILLSVAVGYIINQIPNIFG